MNFLKIVERTMCRKGTFEQCGDGNYISECVEWSKEWMIGDEIDHETNRFIVRRMIIKNFSKIARCNWRRLVLCSRIGTGRLSRGWCFSLLLWDSWFHHYWKTRRTCRKLWSARGKLIKLFVFEGSESVKLSWGRKNI